MEITIQKLNETAMEIISTAGEAIVKGKEAMEHLADRQFEEAQSLLEIAQKYIVKAHNTQTNVIQTALANGKVEYSFLFSHAQDTLMTIESELRVYQVLLNIERGRKEYEIS